MTTTVPTPVVAAKATFTIEPPKEKEEKKDAEKEAAESAQLNNDESTVTPAKTDVSAGDDDDLSGPNSLPRDYILHRCTG